MSQEHFKIWFERTGGFTGIPVKVELDSDTLSIEEKTKIQQLIDESDFFHIQVIDTLLRNLPDQFYYQLTIDDNNTKKRITYSESTIPDSFRPLTTYLMQLLRKR